MMRGVPSGTGDGVGGAVALVREALHPLTGAPTTTRLRRL
jgi:hypothetical protein